MVKAAPLTTWLLLAPMLWTITFSRIVCLPREEAAEADGQDGDGDGGLDALAQLQGQVGGGHAEDGAEDETHGDGSGA